MRLEFDAIEVQEFKAVAECVVLELKEYGPGLHFMKGRNKVNPRLESNGSGKSTLLVDAPSWCFFGKTPRGLKGTDVTPWNGGKKTRVHVHVRIDGKKHVIGRTLNPSLLTFDGKEIGQEDLERKIGLNFATFTNCIAMGQRVDLFFDMQPKDKMQLFVDALALDKWDNRASAASRIVRDLELKKAGYEGELIALEEQVTNYTRMIADTQKKVDAWDDEAASRMKDHAATVRTLEKRQKALTDAKGKADLALDGAETELRHHRKELAKQQEALLNADRLELAAKNEYNVIEKELMAVADELSEDGDTCKTCGQSLKGTALEKHRKALEVKRNELKKELATAQAEWSKREGNRNIADAACRATRQMIQRFDDQANTAQDIFDTAAKELATVDAQLAAEKKMRTRDEEEVNPHKETLRKLKSDAKRAGDDLEDCKADIRATESKVARTKFWVKGFKDVRLFIMEEVLHELEFTTNALLDDAGLVGWEVTFEVERETTSGKTTRGLSIFIKSPESRGRVKWESWSGGEGQRLRLVGAFALAEVLLDHAGVQTSFEVVDEPTQHMSMAGVRDLCGYLADRAERLGRQVWLVDHVAIESREFASVTTVIRDADGSRLLPEG